MTRVRRLLEEFQSEFEAGHSPNPKLFLERVEGGERRQLEAAIDRFLINAPRQSDMAKQLGASPARRVSDSLERSLTGQAGLWPSLLPRLRTRNRLRRAELVAQLAAALASQEQEGKVGAYYHDMEQGTLPAKGVSDRVLNALATIVGESVERLRAAGEAFDPVPRRDDAPTTAFARTTGQPSDSDDTDRRGSGSVDAADWDDVDRLFLGG